MLNVDFLNISNAKTIGRLLPYWTRGRKLSMLLQGILAPLASVHSTFKIWALERYIECHITSQKLSLEWYLAYSLRSHFLNPGDKFTLVHGVDELTACFSSGLWYNGLHWDNERRWDADSEFLATIDETTVYAPAIVDTLSYDHEDYERDIRGIMSKFAINFSKINVIVAETEQQTNKT